MRHILPFRASYGEPMRNLPKLALVAALSLSVLLTGCKRAHRIAHQTINHTFTSEPDYTPQIETLLQSPKISDLKYPDYSDLQAAIVSFYDEHDDDPVWFAAGKPTAQANAMLEAFSNATSRGLRPEDYDASKWQTRVANLKSPDGVALFDVALTVNAARFLGDLHEGRTNPAHFTFGVKGYDGKKLDAIGTLNSTIIDSSNVPAALDAVEPQAAQYKALKQGLAHYMELTALDHADLLPAIDAKAKTVPLTASYPAMAALQQRLALVGDLALEPNVPAGLDTTTDALKHFQQRHGILDDGKLGHDVIEALNTPMTARVTQIEDSMERWRWLNDDYQNAAIIVNLPEFRVRAYEGNGADHHEVFRMNVVDGMSSDPTHNTPVIADQMKYLVFRPFWNVPPSIAKKEIIPHMLKQPGYLSAKGYETVDLKGNPAPADIKRIEQGSIMVRQKSGTSNSLGLVKFMFPNPFNVYLHDTDAKSLFTRTRRDFSHGCVRLQDPPRMANWVLRDNPKWDEDSIKEAMTTGPDNKTVLLPKPIPVVIFYGTAWSDNGEMHFFKDMYGYDADLEKTLDAGRPYPQKPMKAVTEKDA
jgi:murein L,D-transpeptidase YcbB/YkuD